MDGGKRPLKRLFSGDTSLSGCIKISTDYSETIAEWMGKLEKKNSKGLTFIPYARDQRKQIIQFKNTKNIVKAFACFTMHFVYWLTISDLYA